MGATAGEGWSTPSSTSHATAAPCPGGYPGAVCAGT